MSRPAGVRRQVIERLRELASEGVDGLPEGAVSALRSRGRGSRRPDRPKGAAVESPKPTRRPRSAAGAASGAAAAPAPGEATVETPAAVAAETPAALAAETPAALAAETPAALAAETPAAAPSTTPAEGEGGATPGARTAEWTSLDLPGLAGHLADCRRCGLSEGRTRVVFGVGAPGARLMFVGEGPGRDEDLVGEPFVGAAGSLLTDMIEKGMGLRRADVYIANVVKCRPPGNRDPEPDEIASCRPFLERQVELVRPEVVVALGRFAAQVLTGSSASLSRLRGRWHQHGDAALLATFHPAYLLREPSRKREAWQDLQMVMKRLGLERP